MPEQTLRRSGILSRDGHTQPSAGTWFPVHDPATGQVASEALEATEADVDGVVAGAAEAFASVWRQTAPDVRGALLREWADRISAHRDEIADLDVAEVGHLRSEVLADVDGAARLLTYYGGMADKLEGRTFAQVPQRVAYGFNEPIGVVVGIDAYNANPVFVAVKGGPALIAGNCIVFKAPELAPSSTYRMVELALEAGIPPGVINVVTGSGATVGPLLTGHPGVGMVSFTGGSEAGRAVVRLSARNIVPVVLELGGKSPAIVLPDADLDLAIPSLMHANFVKSGQSCIAASRIFIHASQYQQVAAEFAKRADAIRVGLPTDERSQMGSLVSLRQRDSVDRLVARAVDGGASVLAGGAPAADGVLANGAFYQPTVLADVADDNPGVTTEAFGPMASLLAYSDIEEALVRANATDYGLGSQIWGNDAAAIQYLAQNLVAGTVWINAHRASHPTVPSGGTKQSGYGREFGFAGVEAYTRHKSVVWDLSSDRVVPYSA